MGTKGRDVVIWLMMGIFAPLAIITLLLGNKSLGISLYTCYLLTIIPILWFYLVEVPNSKKISQDLELDFIILMPVNVSWVKLFTRKFTKYPIKKAYEIHLKTNVHQNLSTYFENLDDDLLKILNNVNMQDTLVIWETPSPVPSRFRKLIKEKRLLNQAIYEKGGWGIPYPPFVNHYLKKYKNRVYHGAYLITKRSEIKY
ncbi:hypothetical protein V6C27_13870 [Peptococcaceae bacterium 1198_IL3148]